MLFVFVLCSFFPLSFRTVVTVTLVRLRHLKLAVDIFKCASAYISRLQLINILIFAVLELWLIQL